MNASPLLSVLTTAYNREQYIADAMQSVLASSFTDFELIVVDDGSTDRTAEIARQFAEKDTRVRVYVNEKNLGDYPNRNKAASYAKGKYIKYLDSDDMMYPHGLGVMVESMERFPEAGFGLASKPEDTRCYPVCIAPSEIYREHFKGFGHFYRAPGSAIIKREVFEKEGGFSGERMIGDLELWLRLARKYSMVKFPFDLYWNRIHKGQEVSTEYASQMYPARTGTLIHQALEHPDCPLNKKQKEEILRLIKSERKKVHFRKTVKKIVNPFLPYK